MQYPFFSSQRSIHQCYHNYYGYYSSYSYYLSWCFFEDYFLYSKSINNLATHFAITSKSSGVLEPEFEFDCVCYLYLFYYFLLLV